MGGPPQGCPVVVKVSCRIHLMLSKQMTTSSTQSIYLLPVLCFSVSKSWDCVYLENEELGRLGFAPSLLQTWHRTHVHTSYTRKWISTINTRACKESSQWQLRSHITKWDSQMMAMRELKLPMLKHSLATSMKNSITWALCFFFAGFKKETKDFFLFHIYFIFHCKCYLLTCSGTNSLNIVACEVVVTQKEH